MFSAINYTASARFRFESAASDLQKLLEINSTTLEELLSFPNIVSELQTPISTHGFFSAQRIETLINLIFDRNALLKYNFDDGRKYAFLATEILTAKIQSINDFFFHKESPGHVRKSNKVDELDFENDFEIGKELLLSPVNSVKSKSTNVVEVCNKASLDLLINRALNSNNMDEIRAGYLSKILIFFFQKNRNEFLSYFYKHGGDFKQFLNFLQFYSIADFLNNVVLFENLLNSDSMVFAESQTQISGDYTSQKVDFFGKIITHPNFTTCFEITSNVKTLTESFFSKYKNLGETDEFMHEIFLKLNYFGFLKKSLTVTYGNNIGTEILAIIRLITNFFLFSTNSKIEIMSDATKSLFQKGTPAFENLVSLVTYLKQLLETNQPKRIWTNSFKENTSSNGVLNELMLLDIFNNLLKQKMVPIHDTFYNLKFLISFLVFLIEKIWLFSDQQCLSQFIL